MLKIPEKERPAKMHHKKIHFKKDGSSETM